MKVDSTRERPRDATGLDGEVPGGMLTCGVRCVSIYLHAAGSRANARRSDIMAQFTFRKTGSALVLALCLAPGAVSAQAAKPPTQNETRETNLRAYIELMRSDIRARKVGIITEVMQFTD